MCCRTRHEPIWGGARRRFVMELPAAVSASTVASMSGTVVGRRFQLETLAGRGGMGSVWRALDHTTGSAVAVKLLRGDDHVDRFLREAMVLADLSHPHVVRYVQHGVTDDGDPFLAMEWL